METTHLRRIISRQKLHNFSLQVTLIPNEHTNKLVVLVYICTEKERHAVSQSAHRMIGRYEAHVHTLLKYANGHETMNLLSKKGVTVGEIEFEFGVRSLFFSHL